MGKVVAIKQIANEPKLRLHVVIRGAVQGVGFRPFIYRLATSLGLPGWVNNSPQGVFIEVEGTQSQLETFLLRIEKERPPRSFIQSLEASFLDLMDFIGFEIRESDKSGEKTALVLPDIATCSDCLRDIFDSGNRRYLYPFTNCTNCGPRFTIIESLPYDRPNTTMRDFVMCEDCRGEYSDPLDRRFHAQPNACPVCGPHIELWSTTGSLISTHHKALLDGVDAIRNGAILAVKGLGGFHLLLDAGNDLAVSALRIRKHREEKPLALMFPTLESIKTVCEVSELEERLLTSPESPIVLLRCHNNKRSSIASSVAPHNPYLGVMLPYTPLHHLLMKELNIPVVATSGNLSDEPICTDEREAVDRLSGIADLFLVHNRPITRHVDDSIVRIMMGREMVLRRARGYAPLPVHLKETAVPLLAVGAHLKNAVATVQGNEVFLSQHIGDLETTQAFDAFQRVIQSFEHLYEVYPQVLVCDAHPEYRSTKFAHSNDLPFIPVQHHYAHVLSCMAENQLEPPALGVSWDGTGYGLDGTIWGGEFLQITQERFNRVAHLRTFRLPGGERAVKEPRRIAIGLLYELFGDQLFGMNELMPVCSFSNQELQVLKSMLNRGINVPVTSSAGRLFDAVAAIIGVRQEVKFEGQAAMELEFALDGFDTDEYYEIELVKMGGDCSSQPSIIDWAPLIYSMLEDLRRKLPLSRLSAKFHNTLVEAIVLSAQFVAEERIVLTGGCFQNRYLTERTVRRLREEGFYPYWHQRVPPNDGGIALGQVVAALRTLRKG
jgi:hydrogenase maturation protein HypF